MNLHLTIALFVHTVENIGELQKYHIVIITTGYSLFSSWIVIYLCTRNLFCCTKWFGLSLYSPYSMSWLASNAHVFLSFKDGYVPYHSARMELCPAASSDTSKKGQVFTEMLNNCLDQIRAPSSDTRTFMRCDVNFDQSNHGQSLNTMIGRAAHIEFLETDIYAKFIMWSFPDLFRWPTMSLVSVILLHTKPTKSIAHTTEYWLGKEK